MTRPSASSMKAAREWLRDTFGPQFGAAQQISFHVHAESLALLLDRAKQEEREACAYIAETTAPPDDTYPHTPHGVGNIVAARIRTRTSD